MLVEINAMGNYVMFEDDPLSSQVSHHSRDEPTPRVTASRAKINRTTTRRREARLNVTRMKETRRQWFSATIRKR